MFAVTWAQKFARVNRDIMMSSVLKAAHSCSNIPQFEVDPFSKAVNCHHNYVNLEMHFGKEVFLTRKGAVSNKDTKIWCFIKYLTSPFSVGSVECSQKIFVSKTTKEKNKANSRPKNKRTYVRNFLPAFIQFFGIRLCFSSCAMVVVNSNFEIP